MRLDWFQKQRVATKHQFIIVLVGLAFLIILVTLNIHRNNHNIIAERQQTLIKNYRWQQYTSAITTLRCFTTPGCFPASKCYTGQPRKIQRRLEYEEQAFCVDNLFSANQSCLVYSFGIHDSYEWEEKVAKIFGCEVHAFDPTMNHKVDLAPGVTFHKLGLQAEGTNMSLTHANAYDAIDPNLLLSLEQIMKQLGHEQRSLDLLMMDCEGCEWGVLHKLACSKQNSVVKQIVVEFHFQKNLGLENEDDVFRAAEGIQCLWKERWHVTSIEKSGAGTLDWVYAPGVSSILHTEGMLLNIALQRIPEEEKTPTQLLEAIAATGNEIATKYQNTTGYYQHRWQRWPSEMKTLLNPLTTRFEILRDEYKLVAHERAVFDNWERLVEPS